MSRTVLLIGGTGVFGARLAGHLVRHLAPQGGLDLIVASRSVGKAQGLAARLACGAAGGDAPAPRPLIRGVALDHRVDLSSKLAELRPWAVVDCSGPFQGTDYRIAKTALRAGCHMIDLADARDYLLGYEAALDTVAKASGVAGIAGASSTPALSGAVVRRLTADWSRVEAIDIDIVPGGRAEVGQAVLAAVTSYAGRPIPVWRDGGPALARGWIGGRTIDVDGLGRRRVAPVETVDAERLGRVTGADHVTFWAGLESSLEQYGLEGLARLRRLGLVPPPHVLVPPLQALRRLTRIGTGDVGGMVVVAAGRDAAGKSVEARWTLVARRGDGPQIPTLAAAAALRALDSQACAPGARLADDALDLDAILAEMVPYAIETRTRTHGGDPTGRRTAHPAPVAGMRA